MTRRVWCVGGLAGETVVAVSKAGSSQGSVQVASPALLLLSSSASDTRCPSAFFHLPAVAVLLLHNLQYVAACYPDKGHTPYLVLPRPAVRPSCCPAVLLRESLLSAMPQCAPTCHQASLAIPCRTCSPPACPPPGLRPSLVPSAPYPLRRVVILRPSDGTVHLGSSAVAPYQ